MKPAVVEWPAVSDRLATWNEFLNAMSLISSLMSQNVCEMRCTPDGYYEIESDIWGRVRILKRDLDGWMSTDEASKTGDN